MIARSGLRGGLAGAVLATAFSILGVIPICGFVALPLRFVAWTTGGFLGGRMAARGGARGGAVAAGTLAGVIAGVLDGLVNIALAPVRFQLAGETMLSLRLLPQGVLNLFADLGLDLATLDTVGGSIFFAALLCGVIWLVAAMLGALGGGVAQALAE